ncbi:hypothetical protein LIER_30030 [Lithospermum erythrorhizon]|uniref:Uncharacterized protein n=1 Tax=Lithospermum erythrorhizon TaxID=34254 RepID=A0AAV3RMA9_LITER
MFDMEYYSHHFLDHANGVFHLLFKKNPEDKDEEYEEEEEQKEMEEDEDYAWCHLDLKASLLQWQRGSYKLKPDPCVRMHLSPEQSRGWIVDNILFCYGREPESEKSVFQLPTGSLLEFCKKL